jgi:hypothetical protein
LRYKRRGSQRFQQNFVGLQQDCAHGLLQRRIPRVHRSDRVRIGLRLLHELAPDEEKLYFKGAEEVEKEIENMKLQLCKVVQ